MKFPSAQWLVIFHCKNADADFIPVQEARRELAALPVQTKN
jgi:hypothetical protein